MDNYPLSQNTDITPPEVPHGRPEWLTWDMRQLAIQSYTKIANTYGNYKSDLRQAGWEATQRQLEAWREETEQISLDASLFKDIKSIDTRDQDPLVQTLQDRIPDHYFRESVGKYAAHCMEQGTNLYDMLQVTLTAAQWRPETLPGAVEWWQTACKGPKYGPREDGAGSAEARQWFSEHEQELLDILESPLEEIAREQIVSDTSFGLGMSGTYNCSGYGHSSIPSIYKGYEEPLELFCDDFDNLLSPVLSEGSRHTLRTWADTQFRNILYGQATERIYATVVRQEESRLDSSNPQQEAFWLKSIHDISAELWDEHEKRLLERRLHTLNTKTKLIELAKKARRYQ